MKHIFLLLILICSCCSFGQYEKWSFGFHLAPDLCYRWLPKDNSSSGEFSNNVTKIGFHTGLGVAYKLNARLSLEAEIRYSSLGFRTRSDQYEGLPSESEWTSKRYYYFNYVELPLGLRYTLGDGKIRGIATAFISPAIMFNYKRILNVNPTNQDDFEVEEVNASGSNFNLFTGLRVGVSYNLSNKFSLQIQPEFKTGLRSDYHGSHLWSLGLHVGLFYNL